MRIRHSCCSSDGVFLEMADGSMWWRRHEWPGEMWAPVIPPQPASVATRRVKPAPRRRRR